MALRPAQGLLRTPPALRAAESFKIGEAAKKLSDTSYPFLARRQLVLAMTPLGAQISQTRLQNPQSHAGPGICSRAPGVILSMTRGRTHQGMAARGES